MHLPLDPNSNNGQVAIKTKNNNNNDQFLLTIAITAVSEVDFFRLP